MRASILPSDVASAFDLENQHSSILGFTFKNLFLPKGTVAEKLLFLLWKEMVTESTKEHNGNFIHLYLSINAWLSEFVIGFETLLSDYLIVGCCSLFWAS